MPRILWVHLFNNTLSLFSCLQFVLIILLAQYENTLITKLLYKISDVLVLVYLVILFNMFILWFTLDIILLTFGVWSSPFVIYMPSILSLSDCVIMKVPACINISFVLCLWHGLHVFMNLVLSGLIFKEIDVIITF